MTHYTGTALRGTRMANTAAMEDDAMRKHRPFFLRQQLGYVLFNLQRRLGFAQSHALHEPSEVGIHSNPRQPKGLSLIHI